jgi:hypothetical protein
LKWPVQHIHISNDNESFRWFSEYCFLFLLSWICLLPDLTTWITHRVSYAKQEQLTIRNYLGSSTVLLFLLFIAFCFGQIRVVHVFSVLWYVCLLFVYSFGFVLMCPMLPVSLHWLFLIALRFSLPFTCHDN